jgi:hypothetical protein
MATRGRIKPRPETAARPELDLWVDVSKHREIADVQPLEPHAFVAVRLWCERA